MFFEAPEQPRSAKAAARAARRAEKNKVKHTGISPPLIPKTTRQREYFEALWNLENVFAVGPAGSGKTYGPARIAARALLDQKIEKIIIARVTATDKKHALGFLPGKLNDKLKPWLTPVLDGIRAEIGTFMMDQWMQDGRLEIASFEHMRGRTFSKAFILMDEAQNASFSDLKLFLTRIGEESQVVVTGDLEQIDVKDSGLLRVIQLSRKYDGPFRVIQFQEEDVVRSHFTKEWVRIFAADQKDQGLTVISNTMNLDDAPAFLHTPGKSRKQG
jgi:phosphate starvation-inducible PhoH-like protein